MNEAQTILFSKPIQINEQLFELLRDDILGYIEESILRNGSPWNGEGFFIGPRGRAYVEIINETKTVNFTWYCRWGQAFSFWMNLASVAWLLEKLDALPATNMSPAASPAFLVKKS